MLEEASCQCHSCGHTFDPTIAFQRCSACGGPPKQAVRRYRCSGCGTDIPSRFLFDGLVFDVDYFRQKITEHRERRRQQREQLRRMLAESRSQPYPPEPIDLGAVPGLVDALNSLTQGHEWAIRLPRSRQFDLERYQRHLEAHIGPAAVDFNDLPALEEDTRLDRIWRFIAVIFLAHARVIDLWQEADSIMVVQHETDRKGQDLPGEPQEANGIQGSLGRAEAS